MANFNFDYSFVKGGSPIITLSAIGLAFNAGSRSLLDHPEKIDIGYDEKVNAIGIRAHDESSDSPSYLFESRVKDNWVRISMKDFMKYLSQRSGIDFLTKAIQFIPTMDDETKTLIVIVDEEHAKK